MLDDVLQFRDVARPLVDSRRRASQAFVDKILEELREGVRALLEA